jgi:signal transduction histidine kinase
VNLASTNCRGQQPFADALWSPVFPRQHLNFSAPECAVPLLFRTRTLLLITFLSTTLLALGAVIAGLLYRQQAQVSRTVRETLRIHREADALEESLIDLNVLLINRVEEVEPLHQRIETHLGELNRAEHTPELKELLVRVENSYGKYRHQFENLPDRTSADHDSALKQTAQLLNSETQAYCTEFQSKSESDVDKASVRHGQVLRELAWGIAGLGLVAALGGMGLGFGSALVWRQTMRRLQIQIRDAAGKIGGELPTLVLSDSGGIRELDAQFQSLVGRFEEVVARLRQRDVEVLRAEQLAAVGQMAAGVAHEIRNPLTSIKLLVQGAATDSPGSAPLTREDLAVVEREVLRMEQTLRLFLDFARPPRLERRRLNAVEVVEQTFDLLRARATRSHVSLNRQVPALPIELEADPELIRQVLLNLALNALDAMPHCGTLTVRVEPGPERHVLYHVEDTGPGLSTAQQDRLFQPFFSTKPTGLGLGLVISQRIVQEHGGTLAASNRVGGGACFTMDLPG